MKRIVIVLDEHTRTSFSATSPQVPGMVGQGETPAQAIASLLAPPPPWSRIIPPSLRRWAHAYFQRSVKPSFFSEPAREDQDTEEYVPVNVSDD